MGSAQIVPLLERGSLPSPNAPWNLVTTRFAESVEVANTLLDLLIGEDGESGYLGDLYAAIEDAPTTSITSPSITVPDLASAVSWSETSLSTDIYTTLLARLLDDLESGATGLSSEVETALFARAIAREQTTNDTEYSNALSDISGRNFSMPGGALADVIIELTDKRAFQTTEMSNAILIESGRLAGENSRAVIQQSVSLEELIRRTKSERDTVSLDYAKAGPGLTIQAYIEKLRAQVAVAELELKAEVEEGKLTLEGYSIESQVREKISEAITNIIAQAVASLYSSVNASAGISYNGSESKAEHFGHTESIGETHNWEENPS